VRAAALTAAGAWRCHAAGPMTRRSWILMALLAATWGASYMFIKVGLRDFSAGFIVCGRTALAAVVLLPVALRRDALRGLRGHGWDILVLALLQIVAPFLLITVGEHDIPSALAGILVASAPIFTALIAPLVDEDERARGWALAGVAVGIVGVALLFGVDLSGDAAALIAGLMVLVAGLCYGLGGLELKRRMTGSQPAGIAAATMATSTLLTLPLAILTPPRSAGLDSIASLLALGALGTGLAFLIFYTLIAEVGPGRASLVAYLAPGFSVGYGVAVLGESITAGTVAGLALILAGSYLGAEGRPPWRRRAQPAGAPAVAPAGQPAPVRRPS
jgi:drug/metabolite transporter (DMT)-like permease